MMFINEMGCLFIQAPAIANCNDSAPLGSRPKQYEVPNVEPINPKTTMAIPTKVLGVFIKGDEAELELLAVGKRTYTISNIKDVLRNSSIKHLYAMFSEYVSDSDNILSRIIAGAYLIIDEDKNVIKDILVLEDVQERMNRLVKTL